MEEIKTDGRKRRDAGRKKVLIIGNNQDASRLGNRCEDEDVVERMVFLG